MANHPNEQKLILKTISNVMSLYKVRDRGGLDAEGLRLLAEAEDMLSGRSGRIVLAAFLDWDRQGQRRMDPRPAIEFRRVDDTSDKKLNLRAGRLPDINLK